MQIQTYKQMLIWQKKKQTLIQNLFKKPFSKGELINNFLPKEIELCKSCQKLSANFKLKPQNFESYHSKFLCFRTDKKCKKKIIIIRKIIAIIIIITKLIIILIIMIIIIIIFLIMTMIILIMILLMKDILKMI